MKLLVYLTLSLTLLTSPAICSEEDKPVEAWIVYKQEGDKVIEVVKIRTKSGKVYEIRPHLSKEQIPKPVNRLPEKTFPIAFPIILSLLVGITIAIGVILMKIKKEGP